MAAEWRDAILGEFVVLQRGHDLTEPERRKGSVPVMGSAGQNGFHDTALAKGPGVVIGRSGASFGQVHYSEVDYWPHNTALYVTDFKGNDPRFAFYFLKSIDFSRYNSGSAQQSLNRNFIYPIAVRVPPLPEQHAIAEVLGALDDKIKSNHQTSRTLERLARAIFRTWFVDFEPVKAKATGAHSFPSMPQEVFDTLPTRLIDSDLGPMPEGWKVGSIGDAVTVRGGGTPRTKVEEYWEGGTHCWLTPKDLSGKQDPILLSTDRKITDKGLESISSGLLPVGTVLLSSRAPWGTSSFPEFQRRSIRVSLPWSAKVPLPPLYVYHWTQSVMDEIKSRASGTTFPEISKTAFRPIRVVIPARGLLVAFEDLVAPMFNRIAATCRETAKLAALRDYLLPRLLSGNVRVPM